MRFPARLEQQNLIASAFAEPVGQRSSGRAGADDNEINGMLVHAPPAGLLLCARARDALRALSLAQSVLAPPLPSAPRPGPCQGAAGGAEARKARMERRLWAPRAGTGWRLSQHRSAGG